MDGNTLPRLTLQKSGQRGKGALDVVQTRAGQELPLCTPDAGCLAVIHEQIVAQDIPGVDAARLGHGFQQGLRVRHTVKGKQVPLHLVLMAAVCVPVHVDGKTGNEQQVPVHVYQTGRHPSLRLHQDPARHRQGPVEPGRQQGAAVHFHVELLIGPLHSNFRVFLDLEHGRIAVAGHDHEALKCLLRYPEGDDGRPVPGDEILTARSDGPACALQELLIACLQQAFLLCFDHMIRAGIGLDEVQQLFIIIVFHVSVILSADQVRQTAVRGVGPTGIILPPYDKEQHGFPSLATGFLYYCKRVFHTAHSHRANRTQIQSLGQNQLIPLRPVIHERRRILCRRPACGAVHRQIRHRH